jgi:hypothetical protein
MKLSEISVGDLHVGMAVVSAKGTSGSVAEITDRREDSYYEGDHGVIINWDNGKTSVQPHYLLDAVKTAS